MAKSLLTRLRAIDAPDQLVAFGQYWKSCRVEGIVDRSNIDPVDMRRFLPSLFICHPTAGDFVYDLAGTAVCNAHGRDITGLELHDVVEPQRFEGLRSAFDWVIGGGATYQVGRLASATRDHVWIRRLMLPFVYHGEPAIIGLNHYFEGSAVLRMPQILDYAMLIGIDDGEVHRHIDLSLNQPCAIGGSEGRAVSMPRYTTGADATAASPLRD